MPEEQFAVVSYDGMEYDCWAIYSDPVLLCRNQPRLETREAPKEGSQICKSMSTV